MPYMAHQIYEYSYFIADEIDECPLASVHKKDIHFDINVCVCIN